jgi:hypothetical protein
MHTVCDIHYDLFRRILSGLYAGDPHAVNAQEMVDQATLATNTAVTRLLETGIIHDRDLEPFFPPASDTLSFLRETK